MAVMAAPSNTEARNKPVIAVRDLCNRFGEHVVHENLDLDLLRGEILGVVGGSGTGKTPRAISGCLARILSSFRHGHAPA